MQHIEIFDIDQNEAKNQVESSFYHGRLKIQIETNLNFLFATILILCKWSYWNTSMKKRA